MLRAALVAALCATATGAAALSCVPHDPAAVFQRIHEAPETYIGAVGTLSFDAKALPQVDWENQMNTPAETRIPARLTGRSLSRDGFTRPFDRAITLIVGCAGPWCAQPKPGIRYVGFLGAGEDGYTLRIGPCGGDAFAEPDNATLRVIEQCFAGGPCAPSVTMP